ncbi:Gfo/Idh/MocA family oxidoreductase [Leisingera sp. S132]|uniref:Gfo/Idh/MocA family protein n=1 Tax=Leisingera sp. S132 TaxID=2867016 RepID=UPI0021A8EBF6|nr:Gfo/Idh/MocA family oxidoreductase [Leisingera sp. S132]UWQ79456.1 Gfo/Idh/MocA family oxidoreductase [Leisingera sp. S132]
MTRILVSGPGLIGKKHISLVKGNERSVLAAIVAPDRDGNRDLARDEDAPFFNSIETALREVEPDAAIISSPNAFHADQVAHCLNFGIPVLVEKPLADTLEQSRRIVEDSEKCGIPVLVGHHRTYSPLLNTAEEFLNSNKFGNLVAFQGSALFYKPANYFKEGLWRTRLGGGPILINLIHEIGLMRHFCGEIEAVFAFASNHQRGFEVEDSVALTFRFRNGVVGTFLLSDSTASSKSWEMTSGENPAYPTFPDETCYHFAGTRGSLDFPSMRVRYYDRERSWWEAFEESRLDLTRFDPLERQLEHFLDVVETGVSPIVSAKDGYRNMLVIEAISNSVTQGRPIELSEIEKT